MRALLALLLLTSSAIADDTVAQEPVTRPSQTEKPQKPRPEKADKSETAKPAKPKAEKTEKAEKPEKTEKAEKPSDGLLSLTDDRVFGKADRVDGDEAKGVVAFTFDDGPNPETTPAVMEALQKYDIPATFFIVTQRLNGKHGEKPREILARQLEAGFTIGSHSVSHPNLKKATNDKLAKEIDASIRTLSPAANRPIGLFRPPFGAFSKVGAARLNRLGLTDVRWSVDTLDWKAKNPDKLRAKVFSMITKQNGGVVLMHDVKPITAKIIADVLDDLEAENCQRLADKKEPILPVSLHYFLKDGKTPRAIPDAVKKRTETYRANLPGRCAKRPAKAIPTPPAPAPKAAIPAKL